MWVGEIGLVTPCFQDKFLSNSVSNVASIKPSGASVHYFIHGFKIAVLWGSYHEDSGSGCLRHIGLPKPIHIHGVTSPGYRNVTALHGFMHSPHSLWQYQSWQCGRRFVCESRTSESAYVSSSYLQWRQPWHPAESLHCHVSNFVVVQVAAKEKILYCDKIIQFIKTCM